MANGAHGSISGDYSARKLLASFFDPAIALAGDRLRVCHYVVETGRLSYVIVRREESDGLAGVRWVRKLGLLKLDRALFRFNVIL